MFPLIVPKSSSDEFVKPRKFIHDWLVPSEYTRYLNDVQRLTVILKPGKRTLSYYKRQLFSHVE